MTQTERLVDQIRQKAAELAGLQIQLAIEQGDRDAAVRYQGEMYAQIEARRAAALVRAEEQGEEFFMAACRIDGEVHQ